MSGAEEEDERTIASNLELLTAGEVGAVVKCPEGSLGWALYHQSAAFGKRRWRDMYNCAGVGCYIGKDTGEIHSFVGESIRAGRPDEISEEVWATLTTQFIVVAHWGWDLEDPMLRLLLDYGLDEELSHRARYVLQATVARYNDEHGFMPHPGETPEQCMARYHAAVPALEPVQG